jgi:hypothetical protein
MINLIEKYSNNFNDTAKLKMRSGKIWRQGIKRNWRWVQEQENGAKNQERRQSMKQKQLGRISRRVVGWAGT